MITASKLAAENGSARGSPRRSSVRAADPRPSRRLRARPRCSREVTSTTTRLARLASAGTTAIGASPAYRSASTGASPSSVPSTVPSSPFSCHVSGAAEGGVAASGSLRRARNARLRSRSSASAGSAGSSDSRVDADELSGSARVGEPVVDPVLLPRSRQQSRVAEHLQVPGHTRLALPEDGRNVGHRQLPGGQQRQDSQPRGFGRGSQQVHELLQRLLHYLHI